LGVEILNTTVDTGASVIEKHFTLDKIIDGFEHKVSIEPDKLKAILSAIRNIEQSIGIGSGVIRPSPPREKIL